MTIENKPAPDIRQQTGKMLNHFAGYVGLRAVQMGIKFGLIDELSRHPDGISVDELAKAKDIDPFYAGVWARAAYGAELLELGDDGKFVLAPHMEQLLSNEDFPGYIGGLPKVLLSAEMFDVFEQNFSSGKRIWWDECSPEFIQGVSGTGRPFYSRMISGGFSKVPGLQEALERGIRVLELASGAGVGLVKMAQTYPNCEFLGVDGDSFSNELAKGRAKSQGVSDRVSLVESSLEDLSRTEEFDLAFINISMHECRDIDRVTENVRAALKPGGHFVISDFPFPESTKDCRTVPARIMSGIQFFEALIDDQLMPTKAFVSLLNKHGFNDVDSFDISPVHSVIYGRK